MPCQSVVTELERTIFTGIESGLISTECDGTEGGVQVEIGGQLLIDPAAIATLPASVTLAADETQQLATTSTDSKGNSVDITQQCSYESANELVATVSQGGLITAVATGGPVNITVTYSLGDGTVLTDTCAVTVS